MLSLKVVVMLIVLISITIVMFTILHPVMAYYQDLPADADDHPPIINNIRWHERLKQSWAFMHSDLNNDIMEIGYGNTAVARHINKIISPLAKHIIITEHDNENLMLPSDNTVVIAQNNEIINYHPKTIIVHYDGQHLLHNNLVHILKHAKTCIFEVDNTVLTPILPILDKLGFVKTNRYIYLSIWQKKNAMA